MSDIKKKLGNRIKFIRKQRGLTQEQLSEIVGIGTPNISYIECGKFAPAIDTLQKIANALKVEPFELYKFDTKTAPEIKNELYCALESDERLLKIIYQYFLSIRFSLDNQHYKL